MKKIFIMNISTDLGGIEKSLIDFLEFLSNEPYEIDLALWKKRGPLFSSIPSGINVIESVGVGRLRDIRKKKWYKRPSAYLRYLLFKIAKLFGNEFKIVPKIKKKYDIAISYCQNGYSPYYVIDKVTACKKYLWYHHGSYEKDGWVKRRDCKYYLKYDKVITVSNSNKEMLAKHFPSVQIEVIPNLINKERIVNLANENIDVFNSFKGLKITTVGRVCEEKGQLFSIKVANELKKQNVAFRWLFVGDGEGMLDCKKLIEQLGLKEECLFVGAKENPYPYIKQADLYVQTSYVEAECITIKEAIILNKIIIASDLPAIRETLTFWDFGSYYSLTVESFNKAILRNVHDKKQLKVETIERNFLIEKAKEKIANLLF